MEATAALQVDPGGLGGGSLSVAAYLERGVEQKEIAVALMIALSTVKKHCDHIYKKLGVTGRHDLEVAAYMRKLAR